MQNIFHYFKELLLKQIKQHFLEEKFDFED